MEQYFQREGRDWERYAWQKARPVAGDIAEGEDFLVALRPFIYRRYLDFGALDGLRTMKAAIAAAVARKDLADDIKRGPGGIREIEFLRTEEQTSELQSLMSNPYAVFCLKKKKTQD